MKKLNEHSEDCCIKNTKQEYWTFEKEYWGDFRGSSLAKRGRTHRWLQFRCNDPDCLMRIILNENDLQDWFKEKGEN